ncbi:cupin domain-containing protein [Paenibacillus tritici]|uniref:cupin domain-containing protein n=1 Tax=Paenibacillus tritici TaxID=1873425 RepID=UPI001BAD7234|nr:cupin domain-containing protein [Paenibacillus tritici]QUL53278.1 cupin domain-containing protein [Paenibacillus tritici]
MPDESIVTFRFQADKLLPNNPELPAVLYKGALQDQPDTAEQVFNNNGWKNSWVNGVFSYHHYHSNVHEVLGVMSGSARLQLGGDAGSTVQVMAGDVLVLPAGTAHKRLSATEDFRVAGAYPGGADYNTRRATPADFAAALPEIREVPHPDSDPVYGKEGPLLRLWT